MPAPATTEEFLSIVRQSELVVAEELDAYLRLRKPSLPAAPTELAASMVRDGMLTQFQAGQFLKGRWRGFIIAGKYRLLEHLGAGGMATVFLCEHVSMHRRVALKVLPPAQARDPGAVERFYREARAVATLDHPNLARAHDIDHDGKVHFLVMEFVDGPSLVDIVRKRGPLPVPRACNYIRQAALGLHHAHLAGLVHRDIKPGNILVDRSGVVKVLDLGLARFFRDQLDDITKRFDDNTALGTVDFLAPEQALDSHQVDCRADIYSLGATFYALLSGRTPFGPGTSMQKMLRHQLQKPEPLPQLRPDIPEGLAAVIEKMMAKVPEERYPSAAEVHQALAAWDTEALHPPADEELPQLSPRSQGPGSSVRSPVPSALSSPSVRPAPAAPAPADAVLPAPSAATPLPAAARRAGPDWRSWAIIGGAAVLILGGAVFGLHWALSARGPAVVATPKGSLEGDPSRVLGAEAVTIRREQNVRRVQTPHYAAMLEEDGNLVSLKAGGADFLQTGVPLSSGQPSRGAYLYSDRTQRILTFPDLRTEDNVVVAGGTSATVRISFVNNSVGWSIDNPSRDDKLVFCILFGRSVTAVRDNRGTWLPVPPTAPDKGPAGYFVLAGDPTSWFAGKAKLTLTGGGEARGPVPTPKDRNEVWQLTVPPGATRKVVVQIDEATPQELAEVAKLGGGSPPRGE
jgi:serine/threonine protein kinase